MGAVKQVMLEEMDSKYVPSWQRQPIAHDARQQAEHRAGGACEQCGERVRLEAHHRHYRTIGNETADDLMMLCRECHKKKHIDRNSEWHNDPEQMEDGRL